MSNPNIEITDRIKDLATIILKQKDYYSYQAVELAEFIDQFIEKPIEVEPFVVYEVEPLIEDSHGFSEYRHLGFKCPGDVGYQWVVTPFGYEDGKPSYPYISPASKVMSDSDIKVLGRVTPDTIPEFGLEGKEFANGDEVLVKANLARSELDSDGDIVVELEGSVSAYIGGKSIALVKKD